MPELNFDVRWPDDSTTRCYSPSSTTRDFFEPGRPYPLDDFLRLSRLALEQASARVAARYGYACSSAAHQLAQIERRVETYRHLPNPVVTVLGFET